MCEPVLAYKSKDGSLYSSQELCKEADRQVRLRQLSGALNSVFYQCLPEDIKRRDNSMTPSYFCSQMALHWNKIKDSLIEIERKYDEFLPKE